MNGRVVEIDGASDGARVKPNSTGRPPTFWSVREIDSLEGERTSTILSQRSGTHAHCAFAANSHVRLRLEDSIVVEAVLLV
jgi:hypothetical protein